MNFPHQPGFAPQQPQPGFGAQSQPGFGAQPQPGFGAQPQPGFGAQPQQMPQQMPQPQPGFAPQGFAPQGFGGQQPGQQPASYFAGTGQAQAHEKLDSFTPGHRYVVQIESIQFLNTRESGDLFLYTFEILQSSDPSLPPGSKAKRWIDPKGDKYKYFAEDHKKMCFAAHGRRIGDPEAEAQLAPYCDQIGQEAISGAAPSAISILKRPFFLRCDSQPKKNKPNETYSVFEMAPIQQ